MCNKTKTIVTIIVALFIIIGLVIHYCTNATEENKEHEEDETYLYEPLPIMNDSSIPDNSSYSDQLAVLDKLLDSWDTALILDAQRDLENLNAENPDQPRFLYRLGKCCHHLAEIDKESPDRAATIQKGIDFCQRALKLDNHHVEIRKWYGILVGLRGNLVELTIRDRISDLSTFRHSMEITLDLAPNDDSLNYLLGRYMYEVASLSWAQRNLANWLYDAQFYSTYEDALKYFIKAAQLNSNWKENMMYLGKCHNRMGNYAEGITQLKIARNINGSSKDLLDLPTTTLNNEIEDELRQYS